ncbi:MAG: proline reductase cluster protein PrdD [Lachnospiraceae bacterium]|nr:proline reductase cluster protein PrdD [Lachnospiraceae bacterium]
MKDDNENKPKILRSLTVKSFEVSRVSWGDRFSFDYEGSLQITDSVLPRLLANEPYITDIRLRLIPPEGRRCPTNTIMDIIPISAKVLGKLGEGITHTFTGLYVFLTGIDENGVQVAEFGSSEGILEEQFVPGRPGTPDQADFILSFDVTLKAGMGSSRPGPAAAHRVCDLYCGYLRDLLKKARPDAYTEKHTFQDKVRPGGRKVVLIKQVAGQGAMYDTGIFPDEPSGYQGCRSIIDLGNMPVLITPNEYRDGALRAMY